MRKSLDQCSTFLLKKCSHGRRRLPKDRLSSLPDEILLLIMSFLTFEEVVKTSILSRRWLNLWVHTLVIDFHTVVRKDFHTVGQKKILIDKRKRREFVKSVNRVLLRHKGQCLKEFKIGCELDRRHQNVIDYWLVYALIKKVQCLELNFLLDGLNPSNLHNMYAFPDPFLILGGGKAFLKCGKSLLQSNLKCLKSLCLKRVDVTGESINFVLLSCPFLERLEVVGSSKLINLIISDPSLVLKYLKITYCLYLKFLSISNFNLVSLDISAIRDLNLARLPMLVELFITGASALFEHSISQASSCFPRLKALKLNVNDLEEIEFSGFHRLISLKRLVIEVGAKGAVLTKLFLVANQCSHLEEFVLMLRWYPLVCRKDDWFYEWFMYLWFEEHLSHKNRSLKLFEFVGYSGDDADVKLIKLVVKNTVSLEKIIIDPCDVLRIDRLTYRTRQEEEARRIALEGFDSLRVSIPPRINLILR